MKINNDISYIIYKHSQLNIYTNIYMMNYIEDYDNKNIE